MKRFFVSLLCLLLILTGCAATEPSKSNDVSSVPTTQATTGTTAPPETETIVTEPPAPDTVEGAALADQTVIVIETADRNATVNIVGDLDEDYYIVKTDSGYGLIEKRLVRLNGAEAYEQWDGYARYQAKVYTNYHLLSTDVKELKVNTKIQVLDSFADCLVVQIDETVGYMLVSEVSRNFITSSGGGGNGGSSDGGDISLGYQGGIVKLSALVPQSGEISGMGVVLVDNAEIILGWFDRGDIVDIIVEEGYAEVKEGWHAVYLNGFCGYVRQNLIQTDSAEPYTEWDGYARYKAAVYDNYYLSGEAVQTLSSNATVHIICDLGECYLVSVGDDTGYMHKEQVSETSIHYSSGGGGDWTPPAM